MSLLRYALSAWLFSFALLSLFLIAQLYYNRITYKRTVNTVYFHSECRGCISFGWECSPECEYDENPEPCPHCIPAPQEDYNPDLLFTEE